MEWKECDVNACKDEVILHWIWCILKFHFPFQITFWCEVLFSLHEELICETRVDKWGKYITTSQTMMIVAITHTTQIDISEYDVQFKMFKNKIKTLQNDRLNHCH